MSELPTEGFRIGQIFLLKAEFGYRGEPLRFEPDTKVQAQRIRVAIALRPLNEGAATQVTVRVATTPDVTDETALYDFEVIMTAIVDRADRTVFPDNVIAEAVGTILFPFVRETVANLTMRGRFGPVWLNPLNVRALVADGLTQPSEQVQNT